jgi:hypothetical protein
MENTTPTSTAPDTGDSSSGEAEDLSYADADIVVEDDGDATPEAKDAKDGLEIHEQKPKKPADPKAQPRSAPPRKLKETDLDALVTVKVDGKTEELPLKEVLKREQKARAAEKRFQEASEKLKRAEALEKLPPHELLKARGIDPLKFAEAIVSRRLQWEEMDEKDRQLLTYQQQLKHFQARAEHEEKQRQQHHQQQREAHAAKELDKVIGDAMADKDWGLPKHKFFVQQLAATMLGSLKRNGELLAPKEAAAIVKKNTFSHVKEIASHMDAKAIRELLGEENVKKLLEAEVKRVTANQAPTVNSAARPGQTPAPKTKAAPNRPLTEREWDKYIEDRIRQEG